MSELFQDKSISSGGGSVSTNRLSVQSVDRYGLTVIGSNDTSNLDILVEGTVQEGKTLAFHDEKTGEDLSAKSSTSIHYTIEVHELDEIKVTLTNQGGSDTKIDLYGDGR